MLVYPEGMRDKTTVSLPEQLLKDLDRIAEQDESRSQLIEKAIRNLVRSRQRHKLDEDREVELLNKYADELNAEMAIDLGYQKLP